MFYDLFYELCEEANVTPTQVARDIGIRQSTVSMWKNQGTTPRADTLVRLAEYFNTTPAYLAGNPAAKKSQKTAGGNIKMYREKKGLSQAELGQMVGATEHEIAHYEMVPGDTPQETFSAIANALGVGYNILVWEGTGTAPEPLHVTSTSQGSFIIGGRRKKLLHEFDKLNNEGQEKVVAYVTDLSKVDDYIKKIAEVVKPDEKK